MQARKATGEQGLRRQQEAADRKQWWGDGGGKDVSLHPHQLSPKGPNPSPNHSVAVAGTPADAADIADVTGDARVQYIWLH